MDTFTLDTKGSVWIGLTERQNFTPVLWSDLSPFAQGYVEAMFAHAVGTPNFWANDDKAGYPESVGFSDLAPETLAAILKDCEAVCATLPAYVGSSTGRQFWRERQVGRWPDFPPQTPHLGDDGKVYFRGVD